MKKKHIKILASTLAFLLTGVLQAGAVLAAELVATEVVANVNDAIIEVAQGGRVEFDIRLSASGNLGDIYTVSIPTIYKVGDAGSIPPEGKSLDYVFVEKNNTDKVVPVTASAALNAKPGDYTITIPVSISPSPSETGAALRNNEVDKLTIRVKAADADTTLPVFTFVPEDKTVEATEKLTPVVLGTPTATDASGIKSITNNAPSAFPYGETTVNWTVEDNFGNKSYATQKVTIMDTTKPILTVPADIVVEATGVKTLVSAEKLGQATADDLFDAIVTNNASDYLANGFAFGETRVIWTATDAHNNITTATQKVTIVDTTKPMLTVPSDIKKEATAVRTTVQLGTPTTSDSFDVTVTNDAPADFPVGTTTVTWTAKDVNGNESTATQLVTITDTTKPVFTFVPEDKTVEATAVSTSIELEMAEATDIFSVAISNNAPATFRVGRTTVTWTATDANGNEEVATQLVTITDTTKPVFTIRPVDRTQEATAVLTPVGLGTVTATDIFNVTISNNAPAAFPVGTTTVTWTATDANGNEEVATQLITITDTTDPVFTFMPQAKTKEATDILTPVELGMATATDIFNVTVSNNAPVAFPYGDITVTWTARDANGNESTATQLVTITDTTGPVITVPADITKTATGVTTPVTAEELGRATAEDIFGVKSITNNAPEVFPVGTTEVTWTAVDNHDNVSTATQLVTIKYDFSGFFRPVDMSPTAVNVVKAGSAVPIKFTLHGDMGIKIFAEGYPKIVDAELGFALNYDEIPGLTSFSNSSLTYDAATDQYTYVWKTDKSWFGNNKVFVVKLNDGTVCSANFKFK
jgi:hypothetical protein